MPERPLYTLQDEKQRLTFSLDRGLIWEAWEIEGQSLFKHPASIIGPHIGSRAYLNENDPFIDGVGAKSAWECLHTEAGELVAQLKGEQMWQDKTLATLEGQAFLLHVAVQLTAQGVLWRLSVRAESDGLIGLCCPLLSETDNGELHADAAGLAAHFFLKGQDCSVKGLINAPNAEWSCHMKKIGSKDQRVICAARFPEKPILTINQLEICFAPDRLCTDKQLKT